MGAFWPSLTVKTTFYFEFKLQENILRDPFVLSIHLSIDWVCSVRRISCICFVEFSVTGSICKNFKKKDSRTTGEGAQFYRYHGLVLLAQDCPACLDRFSVALFSRFLFYLFSFLFCPPLFVECSRKGLLGETFKCLCDLLF